MISTKVALGLAIAGGLCLALGIALAVYFSVREAQRTQKRYNNDTLNAKTWTSLKLDPAFQSNDPNDAFSSWRNRASALPHKIDFFPIHTLQPLQSLPDQFYYKACDLVPVQDQKSCNTCTIFASFSMLANRLSLISGNPPEMLSVQQFLDCTGHPCSQVLDLTQPLLFAANEGVVQARHYPYEVDTGPRCLVTDQPEFSTRVFASPVQGVSPITPFTVGDAAHLDTIARAKTEIYAFGPIVTVMQIFDDLLHKYRATAYDATSKQFTGAIYQPGLNVKAMGYHAIMVIGWIQPDPKSFREAAWCCVSSWGPTWPPSPWPGFDGLFFVAMGLNTCGIESQMLSAHPIQVSL